MFKFNHAPFSTMELYDNPHMVQLSRLQHIDTLKLVLLALLTLGLYLPFYMRRQSGIINKAACNPEQQLSAWFSLAPLLLAFASLFTQLICFADGSESASHLNEAVGLMFNVSLALWGFAARRSLHAITSAERGSGLWFDGLFTLLLSPFYFNYRINEIFKQESIPAL